MSEDKKRKAVYNPEADKRYREKNKEHRAYLSSRSSARSFIRNKAMLDDLVELEGLIAERRKTLAESDA